MDMSILDTLLGGLFGSDDDDDQKETVVERPCQNCPGVCKIAPDACSVCEPFKEQMIDAIYWVDHEDELISRYEVTSSAGSQSGAVTCPHCGGASADPYVCEYCGSRLQEGDAKIRVSSASEIPDPVMQAQEIIFQRYEAVKNFPGADEAYGLGEALSGVESEGLLSSIFNALLGAEESNDSKTLGNKMSRSEIEEMASFYGVSVGDYLEGLDNGKYLSLSNKQTAAKAEDEYKRKQESSQGSGLSSLASLAGMASMAGLGSMLFGGSSYNYSAARKPSKPKPTVVVRPQNSGIYHQSHNQQVNQHVKPQNYQHASQAQGQTLPNGMPPRPGMSTPRPGVTIPRPGATNSRPGTATPRPGTATPRPGATVPRPGVSVPRPGVSVPRPASGGQKPSGTAQNVRPSSGNNTQTQPKRPNGHTNTPPKKADKISAQLNKAKGQEKIMQKTKKLDQLSKPKH